MSKKVRRKKQPDGSPPRGRSKRKAALAGMVVLALVGLVLAQWKSVKTNYKFLPLNPQTSQTPQLAKEYIYAGSRLVATVEPNTAAPSAPTGLIASGTSSPQVQLSWNASAEGSVDHYQIERCQSFSQNCFTVIAATVPATSPTVSYSDTTVSSGSAYLYRVRAVSSSGNYSTYSGADLATAITFTDDPLTSYSESPTNASLIKAAHVTELRSAVNAVRSLAGVGAATWTNPVQTGAIIRATDISELRTKLAEALTVLNLPAPSYTYPTITPGVSLIRKADIKELRDAVK
jgi:hypothetical protein